MKPRIHQKLFEKAVAAITSAVEIYNKPGFRYRDETFALLALNAWELLLKARVVQVNGGRQKAIFVYERRPTKIGTLSSKQYVKRTRSNNPMTIGVRNAITILDQHASSRLPDAVKNNIEALIEIRDCSSHFFSPSVTLRRQLLEVGTASVRNFVWYGRKWFNRDLSDELQILLPIGFINVGGTVVVASSEEKNLLKCIGELAAFSKASETNDLHFQTAINIQIKKSGSADTPAVKVTNDPSATPVFLVEENLSQLFPWTYAELNKRCKQRYTDFSANQKYQDLRKVIAADLKVCKVRLLDPSNPKGIKKPFYSPNVLAFFDKHYTVK
ncbi:MAG: DUF3644 domain-containing protein [Sulfuritalea sp.]|nr:DUF3644 domain-containing protein [Sulfuritalea sp.]MCF8185007.1 DUF3644 domain-containing protein [Polynucleobacter sp.]